MRTVLLLLLLGASGAAQNPKAIRSRGKTCACPSADLLYRPVVHSMWSQDEDKHPYAEATDSSLRLE